MEAVMVKTGVGVAPVDAIPVRVVLYAVGLWIQRGNPIVTSRLHCFPLEDLRPVAWSARCKQDVFTVIDLKAVG